MAWGQDDKKRPVGRPAENPFPSEELEQEFYRKAREAVRLYYHGSAENTKKPFVFSATDRMGKTAFWAIIYCYYLSEEHLKNNVLYVVNGLNEHLGAEFVGNRPDITSNIKTLTGSHCYLDDPYGLTGASKRAYEKFHTRYVFITGLWKKL